MSLGVQIVQEKDAAVIYDEIAKIHSKLFRLYSFAQISEEIFKQMIIKEIELSKKEYNGSIPYENYIYNKISKRLSKYVESLIKNPDTSFIIIKGLTEWVIKKPNTIASAIKRLEIINKMLISINYKLSRRLITRLLNECEIFRECITFIKENSCNTTKNDNRLLSMALGILEDENMPNNIRYFNFPDLDHSMSLKRRILTFIRMNPYRKEINDIYLPLAQAGNRTAIEYIIFNNLGLVYHSVTNFEKTGTDVEDLLQEALIGIRCAIGTFREEKGEFSTFASRCIKNRLIDYVKNDRSVKIGKKVRKGIFVCKKACEELLKKLGREPTTQEIADYTGFTIQTVQEYMNLFANILSLDTDVLDYQCYSQSLCFPSESESYLFANKVQSLLSGVLKELFSICKLTEDEIDVISFYYGLNGQKPISLTDIAIIKGRTKQRISEICNTAMNKLKNSNFNSSSEAIRYLAPKTITNKKDVKITSYFNAFNFDQISTVVQMLDSPSIEVLKILFGGNLKNNMFSTNTECIELFFKTVLPKINNLLILYYGGDKRHSVTIDSLLNSLTIKQIFIVLLKLGYINGKVYSNEELAKILENTSIEISEISEISYPKSVTLGLPLFYRPDFTPGATINIPDIDSKLLKRLMHMLSFKEIFAGALFFGVDNFSLNLLKLCEILNESGEQIRKMISNYINVLQKITLENQNDHREFQISKAS